MSVAKLIEGGRRVGLSEREIHQLVLKYLAIAFVIGLARAGVVSWTVMMALGLAHNNISQDVLALGFIQLYMVVYFTIMSLNFARGNHG